MDEVERLIDMGRSAAFFRLRNQPMLGVKINYRDFGESKLRDELNKARILKKLGISVPEYTDVIRVQIPMHIEKTLEITEQKRPHIPKDHKFDYPILKKYLINNKNGSVFGLVMEYIADDALILNNKGVNGLISPARLNKIYNIEKKKIEDHGIKTGTDSNFGLNIIWSESRAKLYFIDFEEWDLSNLK